MTPARTAVQASQAAFTGGGQSHELVIGETYQTGLDHNYYDRHSLVETGIPPVVTVVGLSPTQVALAWEGVEYPAFMDRVEFEALINFHRLGFRRPQLPEAAPTPKAVSHVDDDPFSIGKVE